MKEFLKKNWLLVLISLATVVLAIFAVVTAAKLYQLRKQPVAPTAPVSKPKAVTPQCTLNFSIALPTPTPTSTPSPTLTPTPSPTLTPTPSPTRTPTPTLSPTPTPTRVPSPTPTLTPSPTPFPEVSCLWIKAYNTNWQELTSNQLSNLKAGDVIYFAVAGSGPEPFDRARFRINGGAWQETTNRRPETQEFYISYTIPSGVFNFTVEAEIHHVTGWK